jgi:uncharacterized membrane protein YcaP (DUF421 family)
LNNLPFLANHGSLVHEVVTVFIRTIVLYVIALIILRLAGKRAIGKMNHFDFVVAVTFGSAVAIGMEADNKFLPSVVPVALLGLLQWLLSRINVSLPGLEGFMRGKAVTLVHDGTPQKKALKGERITSKELSMELRQKGYPGLQDVAEVTLETTGKVSVLPTQKAKPLTVGDLPKIAQAVADELTRRQKGAETAGEKHNA